jgi:Mg-chelatase subunit ChlD
MDGEKLLAAKDAIETFIVLKDLYSPPGRDRVGLAAFDIVSRLVVPLTEDSGALIGAARGLTAYGGTDVGAGIDEAVRELTGPRRRVDAQPIIVLMTDGVPTSVTGASSLAAADRARYLTAPTGCYAQGTCAARVYAIGLGNDVDQDFLRIVATTPDQYYFAPDPSRLADVYSTIAKRIYATELLKSVRIVDHIPDNMTYVTDSAVPTATYDQVAHTLTWDLGIVPFSGTEMSYWLLPEEVGRWPTNIVATYDGPDGLDEPQLGEFPIPIVTVEDDTTTPTPTTPTPTPTVPSATPTTPPPPTGSPSPTLTQAPTSTPTPTVTPLEPTITPSTTPTVPTATATSTAPPSTTPTATPERYKIYVVIVYNNVCFKRYADVALVIDASTTMLRKDAGGETTKLEAARGAARAFLDQLSLEPDRHGRHDQASIVWFNETAAIAQPLTADRGALDRALDGIQPVEGSRIDLGVTRGHEAAADPALHRLSNAPVVVLLSDGIPNHTTFEAMFGAADSAKRDGTIIYTAGHGLDVEEWALRRVASQPEDYFYAPTSGQMKGIYEQIAGQVVCR